MITTSSALEIALLIAKPIVQCFKSVTIQKQGLLGNNRANKWIKRWDYFYDNFQLILVYCFKSMITIDYLPMPVYLF